MKTRSGVGTALTLLAAISMQAAAFAAAPAQTHPWRIGVAGSYCNGYWGMLGKAGLPRERLLEYKAADAAYLSQYNVVIMAAPMLSAYETAQAIEGFVYNGGIAVTDMYTEPSPTALPGTRIRQGRGPNVEFVESDCPASKGLASISVVQFGRQAATSIIPTPGRPDTYVLARFSEQGANPDDAAAYRDGQQGAPAMILFKYGKGWWLWAGVNMSFFTSLRGAQFETPILNSLKFVTQGELVSRWSFVELAPEDQLTRPTDFSFKTRKRPGRGEVAPPPPAYQVGDDDVEQAGDFDLKGTLGPTATAEVVSSYWNREWYRAVRIEGAMIRVVRVEAGQETTVAKAPLPAATGPSQVHVKRRHSQVLVRVNGAPVLLALDGPEQKGVVAFRGLTDVSCQPAAPVDFEDNFMRTPETKSSWEPVSGSWTILQDKGDRDAGVVSMSANPFRYSAEAAGDAEGRSVTGSWAWDDYQAEVAVRPWCKRVGILAHYQDAKSYLEWQVPVVKPEEKGAQAALVACENGTERVIGQAPGKCPYDQWTKLALRVSGGWVQGLIDGRVVAQGVDQARGTGPIALALTAGRAVFNDVVVSPWVAMPGELPGTALAEWEVDQGMCVAQTGSSPGLVVRGHPNARVVSAWVGNNAYHCWGRVRPGEAKEAALYLRYVGPREYYLVGLAPDSGNRTKATLRRCNRYEEETLATLELTGGRNVERLIEARLADEHLQVWVDGQKLFDQTDEGPRWGRIGMGVRGERPAVFRDLGAMPGEREQRLVDEATPGFAGIIDRHTWGGKQNFLIAAPTDLSMYWHTGEFVGDVTLKVGVRQQPGVATTVASLFLGDGTNPAAGYEGRLTRDWDSTDLKLEALRQGQVVAQGKLKEWSARQGLEAEMARCDGTIILRVNGEAALSFRDPAPLDVRRVGLKLAGSVLNPADTRVETPNVRSYMFDRSPTEWITECGTWENTSRWSCTPGWTWFSGEALSADAWTTNKEVFRGDHRVDMFVGAKMVDVPDGRGRMEVLRDIRLGLCTTLGDTKSGYRLTVGGQANTWTAIERNGKVVASLGWAMPQGGLHNDWSMVSAVKRGNRVSLEWQGHEILAYQDPDPIEKGHVAMGTFDNGLMIPRVTIFGEVVQEDTGPREWAAAPGG